MIISNVRLRGREGLYDVEVKDKKVVSIRPHESGSGDVNGMGMLFTSSFVVPHVHIDKVETGPIVEDKTVSIYQLGSAPAAAIDAAAEVKKHYNEESIYSKVKLRLLEAVKYGVTDIRAFVDVDSYAGLTGLRGVKRARDELADLINVQLVAFPQQGILRDKGAEDIIKDALKNGADVVGGIPWIEKEENQLEHIRIALTIAKEEKKPAAFLVDDAPDPKLRTVEMLAEETVRLGLVGQVEACHARALELYEKERLRKALDLIKQAGISLITNPHTGRYHLPVREAISAGVNVALGQDDCNDAYYPYGRCNMLEVGFLASHLLFMMGKDERETIMDMITVRAGEAIGVKGLGVYEGAPASLVLLKHDNVRDSLRYHDGVLLSMNRGRLVYGEI